MRRHTPDFDRAQARKSAENEAENRRFMGACGSALFSLGSVIFVFFAASIAGRRIMERVVISLAYGTHRYAEGLRILKHERVSDGSSLSNSVAFLFSAGQFLILCAVLFPYIRVLQRFGFLRKD